LYGARAVLRILLIDHGAEASPLAELLEPSFRVTVESSLRDPLTDDVALFAAVVLGSNAALEDRAARCRQWREKGYAGVVVAVCVDVAEGETLLDAGADDFVTVPFETRELATRIRVSTRRAGPNAQLRWGPLELDRVHRVVRVQGRAIALTARESEMLACLIEAAGGVVSRATLRERVWQRKEDRGTNLVEVHLSRLRDKLGEDASLIETVRRAGYRIRR
jgi:DNA-binding response OmpR family regulator